MATIGAVHPNAVRIQQVLIAAGVEGAVRMLDDSARTAAEAASALGVEIGQIANSLLFVASSDRAGGYASEPVLVLTSGRHRADTTKVASLLGVSTISRADAEFVREHTGTSIGGVSPLGHPRRLRTLVDVALREYEVVWAAAGHSHAVFPTTFGELVRITGGTPAEVGD
jgi:prolyl-tRNA editing enzyme YbaK/EbsC (Cys-tRNA(Pro) deacylase)